MTPEVEIIAEQVVEEVRRIRTTKHELSTVTEAARILEEKGKVELSKLILLAIETIKWK